MNKLVLEQPIENGLYKIVYSFNEGERCKLFVIRETRTNNIIRRENKEFGSIEEMVSYCQKTINGPDKENNKKMENIYDLDVSEWTDELVEKFLKRPGRFDQTSPYKDPEILKITHITKYGHLGRFKFKCVLKHPKCRRFANIWIKYIDFLKNREYLQRLEDIQFDAEENRNLVWNTGTKLRDEVNPEKCREAGTPISNLERLWKESERELIKSDKKYEGGNDGDDSEGELSDAAYNPESVCYVGEKKKQINAEIYEDGYLVRTIEQWQQFLQNDSTFVQKDE